MFCTSWTLKIRPYIANVNTASSAREVPTFESFKIAYLR